MKKVLLAAVAALVCSAGFAQGTAAGGMGGTATKEEITGQKSGSAKVASDRAEMKVDAKKANMPMAGTPMMMEMDANGDGMISRREYDNYHSAMWKSMKQSNGMVSKADMDSMRKGGPN